MSTRHFDATENAKLRAKIDAAKSRLPLPALMRHLGYDEKHIRKTAHCPFHSDEHKSFSVFEKTGGTWWHQCFVGCSQGDEIALLVKQFGISRREAIKRYLEMAGFPPTRSPNSDEWSESRECPESPQSLVFPGSPVSNGQGLDKQVENMLVRFGSGNACTEPNTARKKLWKLARDLKAIEKGIRRELPITALMVAFNEWHRLSERFLDPVKSRDDYVAEFLAALERVRVPTGEGDKLNKAIAAVAKVPESDLPAISDYPNAPKSWRKLVALHRELSRLCDGKAYFLSYRDAAKVCDELSPSSAHTITLALDRFGVIKIASKGKAGPNSRKAAEFRCLIQTLSE